MKRTKNYLIALVAMMITSLGAMAQGGSSPLVGSAHNYTVTPQSTLNTLLWSVVEPSGYTINSQNVVTITSVANITWTAVGTYTLQFKETNPTTSCSTIKQISVTVSNAFDVTATAPLAAICNSATGAINYSGTNATTSITFPVTMASGVSTFNPNWEFSFTLTPTPTGVTIANVKAGTTTLTDVSGIYTATALTSASGSGSVNITLDVTGDIYTVLNVAFAITSAKELSYSTPDKDNDDWTSSQTINAIPQTSTISTD